MTLHLYVSFDRERERERLVGRGSVERPVQRLTQEHRETKMEDGRE